MSLDGLWILSEVEVYTKVMAPPVTCSRTN
jgi:hypothetical protein